MFNLTESFEMITPCFCAGADQSYAEVRAPSIRGELRWWFRVLGGTPEQERSVFGGVHGEVKASKVVVRVSQVKEVHGNKADLPQNMGAPLYYLFHWVKAAQKDPQNKVTAGFRYESMAWLAPGTEFTVAISSRFPLETREQELLERAWKAFRLLGSIGLRHTRGLGAFAPKASVARSEVMDLLAGLRKAGVIAAVLSDAEEEITFFKDWKSALTVLANGLKRLRKEPDFSGKNPSSPLGAASTHQASALYLRPVKVADGYVPVVFYAEKILGSRALAVAERAKAQVAGKLAAGSVIPYHEVDAETERYLLIK